MKQTPFLAPVLLSIAILFSISGLSQRKQPSPNNPYDPNRQVNPGYHVPPQKPWSWNLLFKPGTREATRNMAVKKLESEIQTAFTKLIKQPAYIGKYQPRLLFHVFTCPCDSLLYTLNVEDTLITGAGKVATQPPPPPPDPGGSGNGLNTISYNFEVSNVDTILKNDQGYTLTLPDQPSVDKSDILAILDTGLDPDRFPAMIKKLIWEDRTAPTLYNFLPGRPVGKFMDDHPEKHGSAVTGMALGQIKNGRVYPAIMVMKVLDSVKKGSSFSVSCALSYARQHHAKLINMSLGYYSNTKVDSVLNYYIKSCVHASPHPITIFAAAGNITTAPHVRSMLCNNPGTQNELVSSHRFYPACLNIAYNHLVSVTGLTNDLRSSCFYQNYSPTYVTLGLAQKTAPAAAAVPCCAYAFPFVGKGLYEGSSFATPIISGMVMNALLTGPPGTTALGALNAMKKTSGPLKKYTEKGHYITY